MTWWVEGNFKSQDCCCLDLEEIPKMLVLTTQAECTINRKQLSRVMKIPGSIATPHISKGEIARHQVNAIEQDRIDLVQGWGFKDSTRYASC